MKRLQSKSLYWGKVIISLEDCQRHENTNTILVEDQQKIEMITVAIFFLLTLVLKMNGDFVKLVRFSFADTGADPGGCRGPCLLPPSSK